MVSKALVQEISQLEADFCSALSDPTRLLILYALADSPRNVTELTNELRRFNLRFHDILKFCVNAGWFIRFGKARRIHTIYLTKD